MDSLLKHLTDNQLIKLGTGSPTAKVMKEFFESELIFLFFKKKFVILMDEVDGMSAGGRAFLF